MHMNAGRGLQLLCGILKVANLASWALMDGWMEWYSNAAGKLYVDWKSGLVLAALLVSQLLRSNTASVA